MLKKYLSNIKHINWKLLVSFFILGFIFRIIIAKLIPQPFLIMDQEEHNLIALDFLGDKRWIHKSAYRTYGYPLFLALIYLIFGIQNPIGVILVQSFLDALTGILVFFIGLHLLKSKKPAFIASLIYLFNPYTSAYVGVAMTEILSIFVVAFIFLLLIYYLKWKNVYVLLFLSAFLGYLPFIRPLFLINSICIFLILVINIIKTIQKKALKMLSIIVLIIAFSFPGFINITRNYIYFNQFALFTPDDMFIKVFYASLYINKEDVDIFPWEVIRLYNEYSKNSNVYEQKYLNLAIEKIRENPKKFIVTRFQKMWYVWEKLRIYPFQDIPYKEVLNALSWGNIVLLTTGLSGYLMFGKKGISDGIDKIFFVLILILIFTTSFVNAFTATPGRYSLPVYPYIALFSGFMIFQFFQKIIKKIKKNKIRN